MDNILKIYVVLLQHFKKQQIDQIIQITFSTFGWLYKLEYPSIII